MRRLLAVLMAVWMLCVSGCVLAEDGLSAYEIALAMSETIPEMAEVREMPLEETPDRAIWMDMRTERKCILVMLADAETAIDASVAESTRDTAVRAVGSCALYLNSELGAGAILAYQQALAEIIGAEAEQGEPDYILNVNTRKFHFPECGSVDEMKESNRQPYAGDRDRLVEQGYKACKRCNP